MHSARVRWAWMTLAVLVATGGCWRAREEKAVDAAAATELETPPIPAYFPAELAVEDYLGAASCAPCHAREFAAWKSSPHGRGMAETSTRSVLGLFDGRAVPIPGGTATPFREAGEYWMRFDSDGPADSSERVRVAKVIGSGRQHQVYLDDRETMLPILWITVTKTWISTEDYQHASADPADSNYWRQADAAALGCFSCHLSQGRLRVNGARADLEYTDLPINCESCHGPGRGHRFGDLHAISKQADVELCARCHARKSHYYLPDQVSLETVAHPAFRADSTQLVTGYQTAGHLVSPCYLEGAMRCSSCHEPHSQAARALDGESAEGRHSDRQCTVCHRNQREEAAKKRHHRHGAARIDCVDCHMPFTWMMDEPRIVQRVSDHSVSIPRPRESLELGLPNACTTCHSNRSPAWALEAVQRWGASRALELRPWVAALSAAKQQRPEARASLAAVITSSTTIPFARLSALEASLAVAPYPELVPSIEPLLADEGAGTRALAYRALMHHDGANILRWRDRGLADRNPLVRIEALLAANTAKGVTREKLEQVLQDLYRHDTLPPKDELLQWAEIVRVTGDSTFAEKLRAAAAALPTRR